jgi:electron transport complex protein RnfG
MRDMLKLGLKLFLVCVIAAAALGATYSVTKGPIARHMEEADEAAKRAVCSDATDFAERRMDEFTASEAWNESYENIKQVFDAKKDGKTVAYVIKVEGRGYNGAIAMTVGVDINGSFTCMTIDSMNETAGLGAKASNEEFRNQFAGKSTETALTVTKNPPPNDTEIAALSGATITTNAVTDAVNAAGAFAQAFLINE